MPNKLQHSGVLGMKWGRRKRPTLEGHGEVRRTISGKLMAKDGTLATTRRGKLVPKTVSVHGKPVEVNGRAISKHFQSKIKAIENWRSVGKNGIPDDGVVLRGPNGKIIPATRQRNDPKSGQLIVQYGPKDKVSSIPSTSKAKGRNIALAIVVSAGALVASRYIANKVGTALVKNAIEVAFEFAG